MKINSVNDFFQFVRSGGLIDLTPETKTMVVCMEEYGRLCPCDPPNVRQSKYNQCKSLYVLFARKAGSFRNQLMSKTSDNVIEFSSDGQYISTVSKNS